MLRLIAMLTAAGLLAPAQAQEPNATVHVQRTQWMEPLHKVEPEYPAAALARQRLLDAISLLIVKPA